MNIIISTKAPSLPMAPGGYSPQYIEQLNNALRLYFARVDNFTQTVGGPLGGSNINTPFAMFMDNGDQTSLGVTSENILRLNTPIIASGVQVKNSNEIWFDTAGSFLITVSLQVTNRGSGIQEFELWAKQSGNNYPLSNTRYDIPARKGASNWGHTVAAVSGVFEVTNPSYDYLQFAWWSDSTQVFIEHYPAGTAPTRPEVPSVILTVNQISRPL